MAQLSEGIRSLSSETPSAAVQLAVQRLEAAREALALLTLEQAAMTAGQQALHDEDRPSIERRVELPADNRSPLVGRAFVRETMRGWDLTEAVVNAAVDVSSELLANAIRQTRSHVVLALTLHAHAAVASVWDDGDGHPQLRPYRPGVSERGIGLRLVKHLSQEWGWYRDAHGKWVWARLALPAQSGDGVLETRTAEA